MAMLTGSVVCMEDRTVGRWGWQSVGAGAGCSVAGLQQVALRRVYLPSFASHASGGGQERRACFKDVRHGVVGVVDGRRGTLGIGWSVQGRGWGGLYRCCFTLCHDQEARVLQLCLYPMKEHRCRGSSGFTE